MKNKNKITWVNWDDVCKPKSRGGLGVRDLRLVNFGFLGKVEIEVACRGFRALERHSSS